MFQGSIVALVTPMHEDGSLDEVNLRKLVEFHIEQGTDAIVAVGTTGESATLNEHEHCGVIRQVVEMVAGRIPVIAGTGANSTSEAIDLTRCAAEAGADACLLVTPYYNKPTQEGLVLHYKAIAAAVDIPQILYNVPGRTACNMLPETVAQLKDVPNIIGVKDATGDLAVGQALIDLSDDNFAVYSGDDATSCELILMGAKGSISVTANVAPKKLRQMCEKALAGDADGARAIDAKLQPLHRDLFVQSSPIPVKWAVCELGLIEKGIRLPMTWLTAECESIVRNAMVAAELN
ncbi:MAG: 4-hydroxy-tetrahydrodipicolinate synthase [Cycloclasticus sp.]|jgi:4-hydroxy-tetrahydrodipicolinate synthase|tara:strand:- start:16477 stop:17352 length:876 start_codon:yes stop_codon:yes gene_type:complete